MITDPTGTLTLTREGLDALGNATTLRRVVNGAELSREEFTFNLRGWMETRATFADGAAISSLGFGWDADGVLASISGLQSGTLAYQRTDWSPNDALVDAPQQHPRAHGGLGRLGAHRDRRRRAGARPLRRGDRR